MITQKDINNAIHLGMEHNLYEEAMELTEHYLMDNLSMGIAMTKKINPDRKEWLCGFRLADLENYLYENSTIHARFNKSMIQRILQGVATNAEKNNIKIKYTFSPINICFVAFTKTQ